jgi:hypothetical protein
MIFEIGPSLPLESLFFVRNFVGLVDLTFTICGFYLVPVVDIAI